MSSSGYNRNHWDKRLSTYLSDEWSRYPSPFVQLTAKYLNPGSKILEIGTGAGQDGLWLESQGFDVTLTDGSDMSFHEISKRSAKSTKPKTMDITQPFIFGENSFDTVYAQLVLHYFDDDTMSRIVGEIKRVLRPKGILACMVNSTSDPEYKRELEDASGLIHVDGLVKRYFSVETFLPFVSDFEVLLLDENGRTPKDDAVKTSGMLQFIGSLKEAG